MEEADDPIFHLLLLPILASDCVFQFWDVLQLTLFSLVSKRTKGMITRAAKKARPVLTTDVDHKSVFVMFNPYPEDSEYNFHNLERMAAQRSQEDNIFTIFDATEGILCKKTVKGLDVYSPHSPTAMKVFIKYWKELFEVFFCTAYFSRRNNCTLDILSFFQAEELFPQSLEYRGSIGDSVDIHREVLQFGFKFCTALRMLADAPNNFDFDFPPPHHSLSFVIFSRASWVRLRHLVQLLECKEVTIDYMTLSDEDIIELVETWLNGNSQIKKMGLEFRPDVERRNLYERLEQINGVHRLTRNRGIAARRQDGKTAKLYVDNHSLSIKVAEQETNTN